MCTHELVNHLQKVILSENIMIEYLHDSLLLIHKIYLTHYTESLIESRDESALSILSDANFAIL